MSTSYTRSDRVLSVREREKFRSEIRDKQRSLQGELVVPHVKGAGPEGMSSRRAGRWNSFIDSSVREDSGMLNSQIRHLQKNLDKGSPRNLSRRERANLEKQVREDKDYFKKTMVPGRVYYKKSQDSGFDQATKAVLKNEVSNKEFQMRADRFKNNMRELDPENPDSSNIEKFRPDK